MSDLDTKAKRRKHWPKSLKREIIAATLKPGTAVSVVARFHVPARGVTRSLSAGVA